MHIGKTTFKWVDCIKIIDEHRVVWIVTNNYASNMYAKEIDKDNSPNFILE